MNIDLTPEDLAEIEARANDATEGPWDAHPATDGIPSDGPTLMRVDACDLPGRPVVVADLDYNPIDAANAEFIAHARTDVPRLVAEVRTWMSAADTHVRMIREGEEQLREARAEVRRLTEERDERDGCLTVAESLARASGHSLAHTMDAVLALTGMKTERDALRAMVERVEDLVAPIEDGGPTNDELVSVREVRAALHPEDHVERSHSDAHAQEVPGEVSDGDRPREGHTRAHGGPISHQEEEP